MQAEEPALRTAKEVLQHILGLDVGISEEEIQRLPAQFLLFDLEAGKIDRFIRHSGDDDELRRQQEAFEKGSHEVIPPIGYKPYNARALLAYIARMRGLEIFAVVRAPESPKNECLSLQNPETSQKTVECEEPELLAVILAAVINKYLYNESHCLHAIEQAQPGQRISLRRHPHHPYATLREQGRCEKRQQKAYKHIMESQAKLAEQDRKRFEKELWIEMNFWLEKMTNFSREERWRIIAILLKGYGLTYGTEERVEERVKQVFRRSSKRHPTSEWHKNIDSDKRLRLWDKWREEFSKPTTCCEKSVHWFLYNVSREMYKLSPAKDYEESLREHPPRK